MTDLRGSLHNHTNWSDGHETLEQVAEYTRELGCDYWAITDHSKSSVQANGLTPERLRQQIQEMEKRNAVLAREIEQRRARIARLKDDRSLQDQEIRDRLKLVKPDEKVFILQDAK